MSRSQGTSFKKVEVLTRRLWQSIIKGYAGVCPEVEVCHMRIGWVSSKLPKPCGIASYSAELTEAIASQGHEIIYFCHPYEGIKPADNVYPIVNLTNPDWEDILFDGAMDADLDVIHIQHEYALYGGEGEYSADLLEPLFKWKLANQFPAVITFHSVYTTLDHGQRYFMDIALRLIGAAVVHEEYQKVYLPVNINRVPHNVEVIPHGAKNIERATNAKQKLGLAGRKVVGLMGWWEPNKGFERFVRLWPSMCSKMTGDVILVVAGDARPGSVSGQIFKPALIEAVTQATKSYPVKVIEGSFSPQAYDEIMSAFDLIVLPYEAASQSGNLAHAFALGVPAVVSDIEGLGSQIRTSGAGIAVSKDSDVDLISAVAMLMNDDSLRDSYSSRARQHVIKSLVWSNVGAKHIRMYERLIKQREHERRIETNGAFEYHEQVMV